MRDARHRRREAELLRVLARGERERTHGAAVEGPQEREEARAPRHIPRQLDRALHRFRSGLTEEGHRRPVHRRKPRQPLAQRAHALMPVVAGDVNEIAGRVAYGLHHLGVRMAGRTDRNAGREIEKAIAVDVPDFRASAVRHRKRIGPRVGGRRDLRVARDQGARLRSGELCLNINCCHAGTSIGRRWASLVRALSARRTVSSSAVGGAMISSSSATVNGQPTALYAS